MRVVIFRHGPAGRRDAARWPDDSQRPLTSRGKERTRVACHGLMRLEPGIKVIATSPFERALATARVLEDVLDGVPVEPLDALAPGGPTRRIFDFLGQRKSGDTVVLVGHEPDLGKLAGAMVGAGAALPLKKAGACAIQFNGRVAAGAGRLAWLVPPKTLRRLTPKKDRG